MKCCRFGQFEKKNVVEFGVKGIAHYLAPRMNHQPTNMKMEQRTNMLDLVKDLKMSKRTLRKEIDHIVDLRGHEGEHMEAVMDSITLLNAPTNLYTAEECDVLIHWYWTSSDECRFFNEEDLSQIEIYTINKKWRKYERACNMIEALQKAEQK